MKITWFKTALAVLLEFVSYKLGGWDEAINVLIVMIIIDYITGIFKAIVNKELNSKTSLKGIIKKICYLLLVCVGVQLDIFLNSNGFIRSFIIYFLVANDGISILENLAMIGVPFPQKLKDVLEQMKEKSDNADLSYSVNESADEGDDDYDQKQV